MHLNLKVTLKVILRHSSGYGYGEDLMEILNVRFWKKVRCSVGLLKLMTGV